MESQTYVFFGIAGSGKGTQLALLTDLLEVRSGKECVYAYPGGEFRKIVESRNYTASLIKESLNRGELQPDFLTTSIFTNVLLSSLTPEKHFIADGYPRSINQSESFEAMMRFYKREQVKMIYIEVGRQEAMKRNLLRARPDDTEESIQKRFNEYTNNVVPAMEYFKGKLGYEIYKINGEQSVEDVHKDIKNALDL